MDVAAPVVATRICPICKQSVPKDAPCTSTALCKATEDEFDYLVGLKHGDVLRVVKLHSIAEGWVRADLVADEQFRGYPCPRGIDIRIDSIAWVADAPSGS